MEPETTCTINNTPKKGKLYMAMVLSQKEWKLGFSIGSGQFQLDCTTKTNDIPW